MAECGCGAGNRGNGEGSQGGPGAGQQEEIQATHRHGGRGAVGITPGSQPGKGSASRPAPDRRAAVEEAHAGDQEPGWKEGAEGVVAAAATAGIAKVAGVVGEKLRDKFGGSDAHSADEAAGSASTGAPAATDSDEESVAMRR